jgi:hypothetical protein
MTNPFEAIKVTHHGITYTLDLDLEDGSIRIFQAGRYVGSGEWNGHSIVDCPAYLGHDLYDDRQSDEVYDALDAALRDSLIAEAGL